MKSIDTPVNRRALLVNAASNGLAFLAQLAVAFFLAPHLVRHLGDERYGVWSFVESLLAFFTLFDLGIAATLVRYVPKCRTDGDDALLNRIISACLLIFSAAGALVVLLGAVVFGVVLFASAKVPDGLRAEAAVMAAVSVLALAATLPLSVYPAVLDGMGRFALKSTVRTAFLLLRVAGTVAVLYYDFGLISLGVAFALTTVFEHLAMSWIVTRLLPGASPAPWRADRATLKLIRGYSIDSFLAMLAGRISFKTDAIVIGLCGHLGLIMYFDMPARLVEYGKNLIRSLTTTLTPAFSALEAQGGTAAIRDLFLTGCRLALYLALPIQIGLWLFGGRFLELWMRDAEFRTRGEPVLWALAATMGVAMMQSVAARVLYGTGKIRLFARLMLLEAVLNLGLSVALIGPLGIAGVALGTAIPNIAMCLIVLAHVCRMLEVNFQTLLNVSIRKPALAAAGLVPLWLIVLRLLPPVDRTHFAALIGIGVAAFALTVVLLERGKLPQRWRGAAWFVRIGK